MYLFVVTSIVAFWGATQATEESNLIHNENFPDALYSEDRSGPTVTENPIRFYKTLPMDNNQCLRGPRDKTITELDQKVMANSLMTSIEKSNKITFNQKIDLSATFGAFTASSSTEFGWESVTNTKSEESKKLEKTISKKIETKLSVGAGQYYCVLAEVAVYVYELDGKRQYIEAPTSMLVSAPMSYDLLQQYLKETQAFRSLKFVGKQLTTYTVEQMVAAMPANLVKTGIKSMMPEEGKYYTLTSAIFQGVGLQQWEGKNDPWKLGCLPQSGKGSWDWLMRGSGYKTNYYQQWEFKPVEHNPGLFYIVNREFKTALYASTSKGLLGKEMPKYDDKKDFQWKVESKPREEGGTITIKHVQTNTYLSNWGTKDVGAYTPHYNCGPEFVYDKIRSVSEKWGDFCAYDQYGGGFWYSSATNVNRYFPWGLEREFAGYFMRFRVTSPTCDSFYNPSNSDNKKLWTAVHYFAQKVQYKPIPPKYKLWKMEKV